MVQEIFKEVERGEIDKVRARLEAKPALISITATGAPKKYFGQSLLQIALRTAQFAVADMLVAMGADVNFYDEVNAETWAAPVIHDAASASVVRAQWASETLAPRSNAAFATLVRILDAGANVNALDSCGNSVLGRVVAEVNDKTLQPDKVLPDRVIADMTRIFTELISRGADLGRIEPTYTRSIVEANSHRHVARFLIPATQDE